MRNGCPCLQRTDETTPKKRADLGVSRFTAVARKRQSEIWRIVVAGGQADRRSVADGRSLRRWGKAGRVEPSACAI
jgi:hypothetical protein